MDAEHLTAAPQPAEAQERALDLREHGAPIGGAPQACDRRLFMQLQVYTACRDPERVQGLLIESRVEGVLYLDVNDPHGVGVLLLSEDPDWFVQQARPLFHRPPFSELTHRPEFAMFGRTYGTGREADLEDWLLQKPRRSALNPDWPWAVWYPLRRKAEFVLLPREEQAKILAEHAKIGMAYGRAGYAADIRLACHGLDARDNEFVLGLIGPALHPLSALVQEMRKSQQTARYMQSMGPFFVGRAVWRSEVRIAGESR